MLSTYIESIRPSKQCHHDTAAMKSANNNVIEKASKIAKREVRRAKHLESLKSIAENPQAHVIEIGLSLIVAGTVFGFFGKRLLKPFAFILGFSAGLIASTFIPVESSWVIMLMGGSMGGFITMAFSKLVVYAVVGLLFSIISFFGCQEAGLISGLQYPISVAAFGIGSGIASFVPEFATILISSGIGSYAMAVGADCLLRSGFNHIFAFGYGYSWESLRNGSGSIDEVFGLMALWIVMFMWMSLRQLFASKSSRSRKSKKLGSSRSPVRLLNEKVLEA